MLSTSSRNLGVFVLALAALTRVDLAMAEEASGTVDFKGKTANLKYAYLVTGPDSMDPNARVRQIILSQTDLAADIQACTAMGCITNNLTEGMTVDLVAGPRLFYWVVLNGQLIQHSGTEETTSLVTTHDEPGRVAGTLTIDDTGSGGPKVEAEFDVVLLKEFDSVF